MAFEQARQYLARVVPWDGQHYVSIHHKIIVGKTSKGKDNVAFPGKPCLTIDQAIGTIEYHTRDGSLADLYVSMSSQREVDIKQGPRGAYNAARRKIENATWFKSLYLDLDVKPGKPTEGYETPELARKALKEFLLWSRLPQPTVIVASGTGGLHVYWTFAEPFGYAEFVPLANALVAMAQEFGLVFDSQCTVDAVRLLRPPNTFNLKKGAKHDVTLLYASHGDLFLETMQVALSGYIGRGAVVTPKINGNHSTPGADNDLAAGITKSHLPPSNIDQVATVCPFLANELATGGASTAQPLWFLALRLATCCEDPSGTAHRLSSGHPTYSPDETQEMVDRLVQEKIDKPSLGPPKCPTIKAAGATQCATCPMLALNKAPLNVPGAYVVPGHAPVSASSTTDGLPTGYYRGADSLIYSSELDDEGVAVDQMAFPYQIMSPWAEGGREYALNFTTIEEGNEYKHVRIPFVGLADKNSSAKSLATEGLPMKVNDREQTFLTSFTKLLRDTAGSLVRCEPLGWYDAKGETVGFAYNGTCYTPNGSQIAKVLEPALRVLYAPTGDAQPWLDAVGIVNQQKRPALDALILSAFASPLISLAGQAGVSLGGWSPESGVGKTTALQLAQAVWSHPVKGSGGLNDTANATFRRAGLTRNLPLIWDEIKTAKQTTMFVDTIFTMTSGVEKARLNRSAKEAHRGEWQAILVYASNSSMSDAIVENTKTTTAGHVRVFEFRVTPASKNDISTHKMASLIDKLRSNYGHAGEIYAKWLGENHEAAREKVKAIQDVLDKNVRASEDERFWVAVMAAILAAGVFANNLGLTQVDLGGLKRWLIQEFDRMRGAKNIAPNDFSKANNIINTLSQFLAEKRSGNTLFTDTMHIGRGKPAANSVTILNDGSSADRLSTIQVQISKNPRMIRVADSALGEWCKLKNVPKSGMVEGIRSLIGGQYKQCRLGSGTRFSGLTEPVWEMVVTGTALDAAVDW